MSESTPAAAIKPGHPIWEEVWDKSRPGPNHISHLDQLFQAKLENTSYVEALTKIRDRAYREYPVSIGNQGAWAAVAAWAVDALAKADGKVSS